MKKIRYLPFGYHIVNGNIEIVPEEGALVQKIFDCYLTGMSLQGLGEMAQQTGIKFRENADRWNKNMIARMLDDERYWNETNFPPIIYDNTGIHVLSMRKQKAAAPCPIRFLQKKLICGGCGEKLSRNSKNTPRIRWDCRKCGVQIGPLTDEDFLQAVTAKFLTLCQNPEMAEPSRTSSGSLSIEAARLNNEINQAFNQCKVDSDQLQALILQCAAEKYKVCEIRDSDHCTLRIKTLFQEHYYDERLDAELFEQTVKKVILHPNQDIQLLLVNGKVV